MIGRRLTDGPLTAAVFAPGDYMKVTEGEDAGVWYIRPPRGHVGCLRNHEVTEHEDGTITVSPSILIDYHGTEGLNWHGWLERGVWRE